MTQQHILQVSELTKKVRFLLESELKTVWLTGEISNFIAASSGHWYLSLKDRNSQVRCAMFKGNNCRVRLKINNGQQVLVRAKVSLYEPRGDFQLIIEQMEDAGTGLLRQKFEQLKDRLALEGLFSHSNKKRIPKSINRIGIITSPTGAAIKDILSVLQRRNPSIEVFVYPTLVQGAMAAKQICQAINIANQRQECDLLLISRGGGSLEDLWCFNEELVVRTIFASKLAIISAIGHEVDTTLTDYVADLRAPTPSAGAELVSQDKVELKNALEQLQQRLNINFVHRQQAHKQKLFSLKHRLQQVHPEQKLQLQQQKNDELKIRLTQAINRKLNVYQQQPLHLTEQLMLVSPSKNITLLQQRTSQYKHRLSTAIKHNIAQQRYKFMNLIEQLQLVSPLATMARGYSITRNDQRKVIRNTMQVEVGENITIQLSYGEIKAMVLKLK